MFKIGGGMEQRMSILWVLIFGIGNLAIVGLCLLVFSRREATPRSAPPLSREARQTLISLQQLTGEVARRVEDNAERLDGVVRELARLATQSLDMNPASLGSLQGSVKEQAEFASYLRQSGKKIRKHGSRLGAGLVDGEDRGAAGSTSGGSSDIALDEPSVQGTLSAVLAASRSGPEADRRQEDRESMSFAMCVLPLDSHLQPDSPPFVAVARDISTGGMSFSHTRPLSTPYVAVRMTLAGIQDICLVMDRRHTSQAGPLFITGGAFVCRLEEGNAWQMLFDFAVTSEMGPAPGRIGNAATRDA